MIKGVGGEREMVAQALNGRDGARARGPEGAGVRKSERDEIGRGRGQTVFALVLRSKRLNGLRHAPEG